MVEIYLRKGESLEKALIIFRKKVDKEGTILLPAKTFSGLVSKLPDTGISLKANDKGAVKISYKQSSFNINS